MSDFGRLITDNIPRLRRYARALTGEPELADDLVQDCLERAWSKQHLWQDRGEIRPWLFTILHNIYANTARRYNRTPPMVSLEVQHEGAVEPEHDRSLSLRELEASLSALPRNHREVLLLIGLEQLSYEETARVLEIPVGTVMSRLSRARTKLRKSMADGHRPKPSIRRIK